MAINNFVKVTGYISTGKDNPPLEIRTVGSGDKAFSAIDFSISIPRDRKDKSTGKRNYDRIRCSATGRRAEFIAKYFQPSDVICLEGSIQIDAQEDPKTGKTNYYTRINISEVGFPLGTKNSNQGGNVEAAGPAASANAGGTAPDDFVEIEDGDDLPF